MKIFRNKFFLSLISAIIITLFIGVLINVEWFNSWHLKLSNFLYPYNKNVHSENVIIVGIDSDSLKDPQDGGLGRWQDWKRDFYAQVIDNLNKAKAKVIAVDIFFSEESAFDDKLADTLKNTNNVILAGKPNTKNSEMLLPLQKFTENQNVQIASVHVDEDTDNTIRRIKLFTGDTSIPTSFALKTVQKFLDIPDKSIEKSNNQIILLKNKIKDISTGRNYGPLIIPDQNNELIIKFFGGPQTIKKISFKDVYNNNFDPKSIENKIVLIGEMDAGLHDDLYTPVSFGEKMPGVEVHANAIETILDGKYLVEQSKMSQILTVFIIAFLLSLLFFFIPPVYGTIALIPSFVLFLFIAHYSFNYLDYIVNTIYPLFTILITFIVIIIYRHFTEETGRKMITSAFSRYVSSKLVNKLLENKEFLKLGGEKKNMTVMFTDIANFTTISENLSPERLIDFLQDYLERMASIIIKNEGTLDKYIGDAIMAFWGAPTTQENHEILACKTAIEMHNELEKIKDDWKDTIELNNLQIRTGIASGDMVVGNIGSKQRFDYTVIGDIVNLSSRLEGANKVYNSHICVSQSTYLKTLNDFGYRFLDNIQVKGKNKPVKIYELLQESAQFSEEELNQYKNAMDEYENKNFKKCKEILTDLTKQNPNDKVFQIYTERCTQYIKNPPDKDWDMVYTMKTK